MGWISVYGSSYDFDHPGIFDLSQRAGKQLMWIMCSLGLAGILLAMDSRIYEMFAYYIFGGALLLLVITILFAHDIKGSRSWLVIGPFSLQSAEFAKFAAALAIAKIMSQYQFKLKGFKNYALVIACIAIPSALIILQNETGLALVFWAMLLALYREAMPGVILFLALCFVVIFIVIIKFGLIAAGGGIFSGLFVAQIVIAISAIGFIAVFARNFKLAKHLSFGLAGTILLTILLNKFLKVPSTAVMFAGLAVLVGFLIWTYFQTRKKLYILTVIFVLGMIGYGFSVDYIFERVLEPHQQVRIEVALGMKTDLKKAGYNVNQSKIAIGSGQLLGKGFLNGTQTKLKYVPEQDTDFIFCTVGEEYGFWGSMLVVGLFLTFLLRLVALAERQRSVFSRVYGYCVVGVFFFHFAINIGMVLGLSPVIGIPLPFFSYGGSSLLGFTFLLFIFLRLDVARLEKMY